MRARQEADLGAQRADFHVAAPVHALLFVEDRHAERLLLEVLERLRNLEGRRVGIPGEDGLLDLVLERADGLAAGGLGGIVDGLLDAVAGHLVGNLHQLGGDLEELHLALGGIHLGGEFLLRGNERLDGLLAQAVMSLQAVKAVEIGRGVTAAESMGSNVHDAIGYAGEGGDAATRFTRQGNNAGGMEGGISNGEDVPVRGYLKPISTLRRPLGSVSFDPREPVKAAYERSDVCVVPAAGVAAEAMVALTLARLLLEKFGGDSLGETQRNFEGYLAQIRKF